MVDAPEEPEHQYEPVRYRCAGCGNLTRFDVTRTRRTKAYHHFTVGGELTIEDEQLLDEVVESVECRWCGTGTQVDTVVSPIGESSS